MIKNKKMDLLMQMLKVDGQIVDSIALVETAQQLLEELAAEDPMQVQVQDMLARSRENRNRLNIMRVSIEDMLRSLQPEGEQ